jgi:asparagine synthase (glutamine-hydrolysing)
VCGIAGIVNASSNPAERLGVMLDALVHRGPDEAGQYVANGIALGMRRLSIVDVAHGHQPYTSEDGRIVVVFNGEIYGHAALRAELSRRGHTFASHADGEVIAHAYEEYGDGAVERLDGMFAFALYDQRRSRLLLARDRLGKKPLNFARSARGELCFASELHALMRDPAVAPNVDDAAVAQYLQWGYVPWPRTIYRGIEQVPPGHLLVQDRHCEPVIQPYWTLTYEPKRLASPVEALTELERLLDESVRARLMSDVSLGAFLSGGIDSSAVVASMCAVSNEPVKTFAIGFAAARYDERSHARAVAAALGTEHHEEEVSASDLLEIIETLVRHYGQPFADSSMVPTYYLSRMAREHVTVALTGDGGDEILAGYERHVAARYAGTGFDRLPAFARAGLVDAAKRLVRRGGDQKDLGTKLYRLAGALNQSAGGRYADWSGMLSKSERIRLAPSLAPVASLELLAEASHPLDMALAWDTRHYLPDDLLAKVDIATMASSLEARSPLLDHRIVEWAAKLPIHIKQRGLTTKPLLRSLAARRVPRELIDRPKMGFAAPVGDWLRNELREVVTDNLLDETARNRGYFDHSATRQFLSEHMSGVADHSRVLWTALMLELWARESPAWTADASSAAASS